MSIRTKVKRWFFQDMPQAATWDEWRDKGKRRDRQKSAQTGGDTMPQLVKGGKNAFGWSQVGEDGKIAIPPDAFTEYHFRNSENAILMSGSNKSGGFALTTLELLKESRLSGVLSACPELAEYTIAEGEAIIFNSKIYC